MVYFENFEEFQAASREVFGNNPRKVCNSGFISLRVQSAGLQARYTCKYKPSKQGSPEVVLKVTDDTSVRSTFAYATCGCSLHDHLLYTPSQSQKPDSFFVNLCGTLQCLKFRTCSHNDLKYIDQFSQLVAIWTTIDSVHGERDLPSDLITAQKKFASGMVEEQLPGFFILVILLFRGRVIAAFETRG